MTTMHNLADLVHLMSMFWWVAKIKTKIGLKRWLKTCLIRQGKAFANSITFSFKTLVTQFTHAGIRHQWSLLHVVSVKAVQKYLKMLKFNEFRTSVASMKCRMLQKPMMASTCQCSKEQSGNLQCEKSLKAHGNHIFSFPSIHISKPAFEPGTIALTPAVALTCHDPRATNVVEKQRELIRTCETSKCTIQIHEIPSRVTLCHLDNWEETRGKN